MTKKFLGLIASGAALVLLAGCAGNTDAGAGDGELKTTTEGTLTVGISPDFPPMEYIDGDDLVGSDVELITEVADRLGLKVKFEQQKFDQLINSVRTDRVDIIISGMSDTVERQKTLDFIDYYNSQGRFYTTAEQVSDFTEPSDVCGSTVAVSKLTDYYAEVEKFSKKVCEDEGKPAVSLVGTDSGAAARLQLDQGRAQLAVQGAENLAFFEVEQPGQYVIVLDPLIEQPFAAGVRKGNTALAEAVRDALQDLYDDGTTEEILTKFGIPDGLREPAINEVTE